MSKRARRRKRLKNAAPMISVLDESNAGWPGAEVTLEGLLKHYERYGWDRKKQGSGRHRRWVDQTYRTYHQMRSDSLVEVARAYLDPEDYLELVAKLGRPEFVEEAIEREGWSENGEQDEPDVRASGYGSEPTGAVGNDRHDGTDTFEVRGRWENPVRSRVKGEVPNSFAPAIRG